MQVSSSTILRRLSRRTRHMSLFSRRQIGRRATYRLGGILVGLLAVGFAGAADHVDLWRQQLVAAVGGPVMLLLAPGGLAASIWLTRRHAPGARGSGIPQVIATLHMTDAGAIDSVLSWRNAIGKMAITLLGLFCGASIGREGPTVQIGATLMHLLGRRLGVGEASARRALILAGGAAGVSAAFNRPLAGIVFAIEERSHSFESRTSGTMLTAVILSGLTSLAIVGNYSYFGHADAALPVGAAWIAAPLCAVAGGVAVGLFSALLVRFAYGLPGSLGRAGAAHPVLFAALCGVLLAILGLLSGGLIYGTGYQQARHIVDGSAHLPASFFALKFAGSLISYCSGIPGGIFAPSLAVGAGIGGWVAHFLPQAAPGMVVLLGMAAYFSAVVQAPLTATVIVMEMTDNQQVTVALLATSFLAFGISRLICRRPGRCGILARC
ncbi:chloride channel protein [Lichenicoccus sp.]|uniref:chloride channel protein n=1 Tax=Lichenicoccus sp. TaxID=2781899 RepID=UPI003D12FBA5